MIGVSGLLTGEDIRKGGYIKNSIAENRLHGCSYDLTFGGNNGEYFSLTYREARKVKNDEMYLEPFETIVFWTKEAINLKKDCAAIVSTNVSSVASRGLSNVSIFLNPGYQGEIPIQIHNPLPYRVTLPIKEEKKSKEGQEKKESLKEKGDEENTSNGEESEGLCTVYFFKLKNKVGKPKKQSGGESEKKILNEKNNNTSTFDRFFIETTMSKFTNGIGDSFIAIFILFLFLIPNFFEILPKYIKNIENFSGIITSFWYGLMYPMVVVVLIVGIISCLRSRTLSPLSVLIRIVFICLLLWQAVEIGSILLSCFINMGWLREMIEKICSYMHRVMNSLPVISFSALLGIIIGIIIMTVFIIENISKLKN